MHGLELFSASLGGVASFSYLLSLVNSHTKSLGV
jgi:hypothetical protein